MAPNELPAQFVDACSDSERAEVLKWWSNLELPSKSEVAVLLDYRVDSRAYVFDCDKRDWKPIPIEHHHFESDDKPIEFERERFNEWLSHLIDHPELVFQEEPVVRTFHICESHPLAAHIRKTGILDRSFTCPNGENCPIQNFANTISHAILINSNGAFTTWLCWRHPLAV